MYIAIAEGNNQKKYSMDNIIKRTILLRIVIFLFLTHSYTQTWIQHTYTIMGKKVVAEKDIIWCCTENGLVSTNINDGSQEFYNNANSELISNDLRDIAIDSKGNKWLATHRDGLVCFDGTTWTVYNSENSGLSNNYIRDIEITDDDVFWIATGDELTRWDGNNWSYYTEENTGIPKFVTYATAFDTEGNKWFAGDRLGIFKFNDTTWTLYIDTNETDPLTQIIDIAVDKNNTVFCASKREIFKCDGNTWTQIFPVRPEKTRYLINSLEIDRNNTMWICTGFDGVGKYDGSDWIFYNWDVSGPKIPDLHILSMALDSTGIPWFGTFRVGVLSWDEVQWTKYSLSPTAIHGNEITSIFIDSDNNNWVGCLDNGIAKLRNDAWTCYPLEPFNRSIDAYAVHVDRQSNVLAGTDKGLIKFTGTEWFKYDSLNSGLKDNHVYAVVVDDKENIWVGTAHAGLFMVDTDTWIWTNYTTGNSDLTRNSIKTIILDSEGAKWIGTEGGGVCRFKDTTWTVYTTENSDIVCDTVWSMVFDKEGTLWLATESAGLLTFDGTTWTDIEDLPGFYYKFTLSVAIDSANVKWAGTRGGGLLSFDGTTWTVYDHLNSGLPSDYVNTVVIDKNENKLIGTQGGLALYNGDGIVTQSKKETVPAKHDKLQITYSPSCISIHFHAREKGYWCGALYNCRGRMVKNLGSGSAHSGQNHIRIKYGTLAKGTYLVSIVSETGQLSKKILIY